MCIRDSYGSEAWDKIGNVEISLRRSVDQVVMENGKVQSVIAGGEVLTADAYVSALPFERAGAMLPQLNLDLSKFEHSPITGIHLWFDRPITNLPHATLLDRTIQWMYNKRDGHYVQLVVSASRSFTQMPRGDVIALGLRELAEFFPKVSEAKLERAEVVKEVKATFSAEPGLEAKRPSTETRVSNLFLAGDWTKSGWPSTMEGAVRSGYKAAEAVAKAAGVSKQFLLLDIA